MKDTSIRKNDLIELNREVYDRNSERKFDRSFDIEEVKEGYRRLFRAADKAMQILNVLYNEKRAHSRDNVEFEPLVYGADVRRLSKRIDQEKTLEDVIIEDAMEFTKSLNNYGEVVSLQDLKDRMFQKTNDILND